MKKSTLKLGYIIMSTESEVWLSDNAWGNKEGSDLYDAQVFTSETKAQNISATLEKTTTIYEIGIYNGKPVMLLDPYKYYMDAKYT